MNQFLVIAVTILGANAALDSSFVEKVMNEMTEVGKKCAEESKATSEDLAEIHAHKMPPTSHEAKCVLACFYKHYNIMNSSGTFDRSAVIAAFEPMKKMDNEIYDKVMKIADACDKSEVVDDHCETASIMAACVCAEADKVGLTKEEFMMVKKP